MNSNFPSIRFSEFKSSWEIRQIGDLLVDVSRPIKMEDDQIYQLVTVKRRNAGIVSRGYFKGADVLVKSQFIVQAGDYLISKRQIVHGANGIVPEHLSDSIVSNEYLVLHGTNELNVAYLSIISKLPSMYKMFYLSSYGVDIEKLVFNVSDWKKRELAIPSIEEQAKITLFFNELDKLISLHQQELEVLKKTRQGFLQKMFPRAGETIPELRFSEFTSEWTEDILGNHVTILTGGTPNTKNKEFWFPKEVPWLSSGEVNKKRIRDTEKEISKQGLNNSSARWVEPHSVLIALAGQGKTRGTVAVNEIPLTTNQSIAALTPSKSLNAEFLYQSLEKRYEELRLVSSGDGTRGGLNKKILSELIIQLTNIKEQIKIGEFFRQLDEVIELKEKELEALNETKKGFLQKMFV